MVDRNVSITQSVSKSASITQSVTRAVSIAEALGSPYDPLSDTNPILLSPLQYASTAVDGQILYQDSGATTPVTTASDPVSSYIWDGMTTVGQTTDSKRPTFNGSDQGVAFDGSDDIFIVGSAGDLDTIHQNGGTVAVAFRMDARPDGAVVDIARNGFTANEHGFGMYWDNRDPGGATRPDRDHAFTFFVYDGSGTAVYSEYIKVDDPDWHVATMAFDGTGFDAGIDGSFTLSAAGSSLGVGSAVEPLNLAGNEGSRFSEISLAYFMATSQVVDETTSGTFPIPS